MATPMNSDYKILTLLLAQKKLFRLDECKSLSLELCDSEDDKFSSDFYETLMLSVLTRALRNRF